MTKAIERIKLFAGMLLTLACAASCSNTSVKTNNERARMGFETDLRMLCSAVENYNDLLGKKPGNDAWKGYAELLSRKLEQLKTDHEEEMDGEMRTKMDEMSGEVGILTSGSANERGTAQKKLFTIEKYIKQKYKL